MRRNRQGISRRSFSTAGLVLAAGAIFGDRRPRAAMAAGAPPTQIRIPRIGTDAPVEVRTTRDGTMEDPTSPWVVAWYDDSAPPGADGNAVFAGHLDDLGGPAVFAHLALLVVDDAVDLTGGDGIIYRYRVRWSKVYPVIGGPWWDVTGPTASPSTTLITCAGAFDPAAGTYEQRLVVRSEHVWSATDIPHQFLGCAGEVCRDAYGFTGLQGSTFVNRNDHHPNQGVANTGCANEETSGLLYSTDTGPMV